LNEPNVGVPIKKRPFQLTNPSSLESEAPSLDKFSHTPKHFTPKSPLDFLPLGFDPGNTSSSDSNKQANLAVNPLHDLNAIDMGRNYCMLKSSTNSDTGMDMLEVGNAPKLHLSISDDMMNKEKFNQCSTDLSLTGPSTVSSKACFKPSYNLSNNMEKRSVFDLNFPTSDTWDYPMDGFTSENNGIANTEPVEALSKQGRVNGMIPHGKASGVTSNGVVSGLVPMGASNNLMLPNLDKSYENCNLSELTLDLQLKLPPRPELRMKNLEPVCSSDLSLSLSGKDLNSSPEQVNVRPELVRNSQKRKNKYITDPNAKPMVQNQVIVKQESCEVISEKNVQASGLKDQDGSVVKKEPMDGTSCAQHPLGKLLDKSPSSESESGLLAKQVEIHETNNLTKGIDLNFATPLTDVSTIGKAENPVLSESAVTGYIVQPTVSQSDAHHNHENIDSRKLSLNTRILASTSSPFVATQDIKPMISPSAFPALVVDNSKKMVSMASDGLSQSSTDMDCSEGHNLPKSAMKNTNCETNASSSSSVAKIPKQEPGNASEFENVQIRERQRGENVKSLVPSSIPTLIENQIQIPKPAEVGFAKNNENDIPFSCTKPIDLPNRSNEGFCLDMEAGDSKSRSPSTSMSRRDKEVDPSSERENSTSSRRTAGNDILHKQFKRTELDPDRAQFERKKSRMSSWDGGSNIYSNRY
jgi:hypothetical protein